MMRRMQDFAARLRRDECGAMLIETAIVAPVLLLLSMGAFQISQVIARQTELQVAAAEVSAIAVSAPPETNEKRAILKNIIVASTGLDISKVNVSERFRCGSANIYTTSTSGCTGTKISSYVLIELTDTYTPAWVNWGFGEPLNFNVARYVMVKQS